MLKGLILNSIYKKNGQYDTGRFCLHSEIISFSSLLHLEGQ
ncbi:hypothetical protein VME0621_04230 [Vibrio mediterranei]|nr:hypothetical protein VME0621_04230 [Vibrio mediterranei]